MAESPFYVNVRESRVAKEPEPQYYTNVELVQNDNGKCEEYQIVEERGRDPKGEYTATINSAPDKVNETTLKRQKMIHSLLFPSKTKERRFNYTDIQLTPATQDEEEQQAPGPPLAVHPNRSRPQVKPKPKPESVTVEPDESFEQSEDPYVCNEAVTSKEPSTNGSCKMCTWKCTSVLFLVLFIVSICISIVAISIAVTVFTKLPPHCEDDLMSTSCTITPSSNGTYINNSCDTSLEDLGEVFKVCLVHSTLAG